MFIWRSPLATPDPAIAGYMQIRRAPSFHSEGHFSFPPAATQTENVFSLTQDCMQGGRHRQARTIGKQSYRLLAPDQHPVLMSTTREFIQTVQIYLTVQVWAHTGSNSRALCRVTDGPYPPRNYVSDDMASSHAETARWRGKRAGMQSPTLRPKAGF